MIDTRIPRWLNYRPAARAGETIVGCVPVPVLTRLQEAVLDVQSAAHARLRVFEDDQRWARIDGGVECALRLRCARCREPVIVNQKTRVAAIIVACDEQAADVPHRDEPVIADDEWLDVHATIEDEILLALPLGVHCDRAACRRAYASSEAHGGDPTYRPFAGLAARRNRETDR